MRRTGPTKSRPDDHHAPPADAPHDPAWRARASALGWRDVDLDGLASILAIRRDDTENRVTRVTARRIFVASFTTLHFDGVGRDGAPRRHAHRLFKPWVWRRHDPPVSTIRSADEPEPVTSTTTEPIAVRDIEPWPTRFRDIEEIVRSIRVGADTKPAAETVDDVPRPATPKKKPEKRRRGAPLPGQITLEERRR